MDDEDEFGYETEENDVRSEPLNYADVLWLVLAPPLGFFEGVVLLLSGLRNGLHNTSVAIDRKRIFARAAVVDIETITRGHP